MPRWCTLPARANASSEAASERIDFSTSCNVDRRYASAVGSPKRLHNAAATASRSAGSIETVSGWRALDMIAPGEGMQRFSRVDEGGLNGERLHTGRIHRAGPATDWRVQQVTDASGERRPNDLLNSVGLSR